MTLDNNLVNQIREEEFTLIIQSRNEVIIEDNRFGVICLVENYNFTLEKINIYDKLIGRGAAMLMTKLNVENIYAKTITKSAIEILSPICNLTYDRVVDNILNRHRDDLCPIEKIASGETDVDRLYELLLQFYVERGHLDG